MPLSFLPKIMIEKLTDITPEFLQARSICLLMLDFDNTMLPYTSAQPTAELLSWLEKMKQSNVTLCVVSNSKKEKAKNFCGAYGIDCITHSGKPFQRGIRQCLAKYGAGPKRAALVGDQIYTDVLGGNCAGVCSILVEPLHLHSIWLKLRHAAEQPFIFLARKRRVKL